VHATRLLRGSRWAGLSVAMLALLCPSLRSMTFYVATNGDDSNPGTQGAPFASIQRGVDRAGPGDTISVADGTYGPNGHFTCGTECSQDQFAAPVKITKSGAPGAFITIAAQNKWGAVLDCQLPHGYSGDGTDGVQACDAFFDFQGSASYITISGFDIRRAYWVGAMVNSTNSHINFIGNHFHYIGNRIYDVPPGTSSYGIVGVFAGSGSSDIVWDGNQFDNIGRLPHQGQVVSDDYTHDHGLYINNGPYTIINNIFFSQPAGWNVQISPGSHDVMIANNTMIGGANPQKHGVMILWGQNKNIAIQNNIFYGGWNYAIEVYDTEQTSTLIDHNLVVGGRAVIPSVRGSVAQTNNRFDAVDPLFVNPATNDFHLQAGSPAIDSGASVPVPTDFDGNPRPVGTAVDIGAYEYGAATSPARIPAP
jgi:hypothetical protein